MANLSIIYLNGSNFPYSQVSIGLASICTYLKQFHHNVTIYNTNNCDINELVLRVVQNDSEYIGFSITEPQFKTALLIANEIKNKSKNKIIIFGGPYPTLSPEDCLKSINVDCVCVGDGEYSLQELLEGNGISNIKGLWYKLGENIVNNGISKPFDLNSYEITDYSAFTNQTVVSKRYFGKDEIKLVFTWSSRSCNYQCTYCCNHQLNQILKYGMRYRKIENLLLEIQSLINIYHPEGLFLSDENFLYNRRHTLELSTKYKLSKLNLPFGFLSRPEHICDKNLSVLKNLKDSGWKWVSVGVEIGNELERNKYLNRKNRNKEILRAFEICRKLGIFTNAFLISGFYFEDHKDILMTKDLIDQCNPDNVECSIYYPLSKSVMGEYYKKTGMISLSNGINLDYFNDCIITHPLFSEVEIRNNQINYQKSAK